MFRCVLTLLTLASLTATGCQSGRFRTAFDRWGNSDPAADFGHHSAPPLTGPQTPGTDAIATSFGSRSKGNTASNVPNTDVLKALSAGRAAEARRDDPQAVANYSKVLSIHPEHPIANHRLAVIADRQKDYALAERHYQIALKQTPNNPDLLCDLGYSYLLQGRYLESKPFLEHALQLAPGHQVAANNMGVLFGKMEMYNESLAMFRRAGTEAEAMEKIERLFPDGPPANGMLAANAPGAKTAGVSTETQRIKAMMDQARQVSLRRKQMDERHPMQTGYPTGPEADRDRYVQRELARIRDTETAPSAPAPRRTVTDPRDQMPLWNPQPQNPVPAPTDPRMIRSDYPVAGRDPRYAPQYGHQGQPIAEWPHARANVPADHGTRAMPAGHHGHRSNAVSPATYNSASASSDELLRQGMNVGPGVGLPTVGEDRAAQTGYGPHAANPAVPGGHYPTRTSVPNYAARPWHGSAAGSPTDPMQHLYRNPGSQNHGLPTTGNGRAPISQPSGQPYGAGQGYGPGYPANNRPGAATDPRAMMPHGSPAYHPAPQTGVDHRQVGGRMDGWAGLEPRPYR